MGGLLVELKQPTTFEKSGRLFVIYSIEDL